MRTKGGQTAGTRTLQHLPLRLCLSCPAHLAFSALEPLYPVPFRVCWQHLDRDRGRADQPGPLLVIICRLCHLRLCLLCLSGFVGSNLVETEAEQTARTTFFITQRIPHWVWITGYVVFGVLAIGLVPQVCYQFHCCCSAAATCCC